MADYNPNRKSRSESNELPSNHIYPSEERRNPAVVSKPGSARPTIEFADDVRIVYSELMQLLLSKHKDYGPTNIANAPGGALNGLRVRMHDKLARINNLVDMDINPEHESLEDSFKDMANYAIIGLLVLRDKWDK